MQLASGVMVFSREPKLGVVTTRKLLPQEAQSETAVRVSLGSVSLASGRTDATAYNELLNRSPRDFFASLASCALVSPAFLGFLWHLHIRTRPGLIHATCPFCRHALSIARDVVAARLAWKGDEPILMWACKIL